MNAKKSSIVTESVQKIHSKEHLQVSTWFVMGVLVVSLIILKTFIYIKDEKRYGK